MNTTAKIAALALVVCAAPALAAADWTRVTLDPHAARLAYPAGVFDRVDSSNPRVEAFRSRDGSAKFVAGSWRNDREETPAEFKQTLTEKGQLYADVTYAPKGRNWFVLSGYRGSDIYYEKIMFSCGRNLVSVFAISYPQADRRRYDPIVERMEDEFSPGRAC
jgi:hypothetical protein